MHTERPFYKIKTTKTPPHNWRPTKAKFGSIDWVEVACN